MKTPGNNGSGTPAAASTSTSAAATTVAPPSEGSAATAERKNVINPELWLACAGPLANIPPAGTHVVYFPQGHSEQVAASMKKDIDAQVPNYPNLPPKLLCLLLNVTLHADPETDEVFAQMTLQPVSSFDKESLLRSDLALKSNKPQPEFFCKTLTASDTSTHGGFSVPRRAAEKIFPPLDFSMQPPAQELVARDLHDNVWNFRHIFRGQPKRHLLTTGWSLFVSGKRLSAGDSVLVIRDEKQLLLGTRRANRQPTNLSSSVLSSDSMHIGTLAAAAHAAANNSPFTVFYNPRASPSEFIIPLAKYYKAVYSNQISLGMRFRMLFETEELGTRRYMGTITGISDIDPVRWKNSQWRNLQVGWDESTAGEKRTRVSIWEIEPVTAPFFICPPPLFGPKRPRQPGFLDDDFSDSDGIFKRTMPWLDDDISMKDTQALSGIGLMQWMNMQQNHSLTNSMQHGYLQSMPSFVLQNLGAGDLSRQIVFSTQQNSQPSNLLFSAQRLAQQTQSLDQLKKSPETNPLSSSVPPLQLVSEVSQHTRQTAVDQTVPSSQCQAQILQQQTLIQSSAPVLQQQSLLQKQKVCGNSNLPQSLHQMQQQSNLGGQSEQLNTLTSKLPDPSNPQLPIPDNRIQLQLLQKLQQQQQQSLLAQQSYLQQSALINSADQMQHLDASQCLLKTVTPSEMTDMALAKPSSSQSTSVQPQVLRSSSQQFIRFSNQPQPMKSQPEQHIQVNEIPGNVGFHSNNLTNQASNAAGGVLSGVTRGGQSVITDDALLSCPVSSSRNNFQQMFGVESMMISRTIHDTPLNEDLGNVVGTFLSPSTLEIVGSSADNLKKDFQKFETKPSLITPNSQNKNHGSFGAQTYVNSVAAQSDYLDASSSTTSVCLSQNDVHLQQNNSNSISYNRHSKLYRDANQDGDVQADIRSGVVFGSSPDARVGLPMDADSLMAQGIMGLGKELSSELLSAALLTDYNQKDTQQISSSMVSQSFGVADVGFASMDSPINESTFLNRGPWGAPPPQFQRMRTFTKVYKRGAVGRSIDITRYSGYDDLKQDLARRFGIEGQLEDGQRIGWKLVYVDHENDVLLVGDDPWEEFVNCVRCIKILSPLEVQKMSLDGDFGNSVLPNHTCSSSDGGNL